MHYGQTDMATITRQKYKRRQSQRKRASFSLQKSLFRNVKEALLQHIDYQQITKPSKNVATNRHG